MSKTELLRRLRKLRKQYEKDFLVEEIWLPDYIVYGLFDVCQALDLNEAETKYVLGEYYETRILRPVPYALTPSAAFVAAFDATPSQGVASPVEE